MEMKKSGAIIIEGHVQGLSNVRALGEQGIPVIVIDVCHCLAQHSKYCQKFYKCPPFSSSKFIEFLIELCEKTNLYNWVLIPSNDHIVENLSIHKKQISSFYKTIVPDWNILQKIINKKELLNVASLCNTPIPNTCYPETVKLVENFTFPLLLKGNMGLSFYKIMHSKAIQVNNLSEFNMELDDVLDKVDSNNIMIQELIPYDKNHKVISFTCFAIDGEIKTYWIGEKLREHPIKYGTATLSRSIYNSIILKQSESLIEKLKYSGVCEVEYLFDNRDSKYKLIEINPRTWLWVELAKQCGINYALMIYNYANKIPNEYPKSYKIDYKWINRVTDFVYSIKSWIKGHLSIREYFSQKKGKKVYAIHSKKDIIPSFVFPFLLIYIYLKRR